MLKRPTAIICNQAQVALFTAAGPEVSRLMADIAKIDRLSDDTAFDENAAYSVVRAELEVAQKSIPVGYASLALVQDPVERVFNSWRYLANFRSFQAEGIVDRLVARNMSTDPAFVEFIEQISRYLRVSATLRTSLKPAAACIGKKLASFTKVYRCEDFRDLRSAIFQAAGAEEQDMEEWSAREPRPILDEATVERLKSLTKADYKFLNAFYSFDSSRLLERAYRPGLIDLSKLRVLTAPAAKPYPALRLVSLMRETPEITRAFVEHYRKIGVEKMFLFLDDPDDPMADEFASDPFVDVTRCDTDFWPDGVRPGSVEARQGICYTQVYNMFETGWLICCDADELIYANDYLARILERTEPDQWVIRAISSEAVWMEGEDFTKLFSATHVRWRLKPPHWPRVRTPVYGDVASIVRYNMLAHTFGKYIIRCGLSPERLAVHMAVFSDDLSDQQLGFDHDNRTFVYLVHHDAPSFDDWCKKLERRLKSGHGFVAQGDYRELQIKAFRKAREVGNEEALFRKLYVLDENKLKLLANCGVLARIGSN